MAELIHRSRRALANFWAGVRELTGDSAYEQYLARQRGKGNCDLLSREEFYRQRLERKYNRKDSPARCC